MSLASSDQKQKLLDELEGVLEEYYPILLRMLRDYRESILFQPGTDSFRRGWEEARKGATSLVERLWEGLDVE